ncbi:MAG TPA: phosphohistidine phosphatase SixA [Verrucomicrobiae bacterium]|jgi:phosphohistidine phosphatase|nr:phosphohistidine phosphatase SixA [Verrucomicrobiae bacterium]
MNLFFLRHGKAEPRSVKWRPDSKRPLTRDGEKRTAEVARGAQALDLNFDLILTSPYVRAFRTAEILADVYGARKLFETKNLISEAEPKAIVSEINENFASIQDIVLVGHEPFMTRLIAMLIAGEGAAVNIELKKAGLCKLSIEKLTYGKCACLNWLLTPRQLARLGGSGKD